MQLVVRTVDSNDYKNLINEYDELHLNQPDLYPLSFDEYVDGLHMSFSKENYINAPKEKKISVALLWMREGRPQMKYYSAFKLHDMELLNNVMFETAQLMQISNISSPGTDHGFYGMNITPNLLAANMMERIKLILPEENGLSDYSFSGAQISNLLMAIIYNNHEFKEEALILSERELNKKIPQYIKSWIRCMRAILTKDCEQINEQLAVFCKAYMSCKEFGMNGFNRRFCVEAHGIYNLAIWAYDRELKKEIIMPETLNFCQELAVFQAKHNFGTGETVHIYPDNMDVCNKLMRCEPPRMYLKSAGKKRVIDVDRFAEDIVNIIA